MRTILALIQAWLIVVAPVAALQGQGVYYAKAASGATYVAKDSNSLAQNGVYELAGTLTTSRYLASKFLSTSAYNLNRVDVYLAKVGSPTNDIICEIWSDGGTFPGALLGTSSAAINASTFSTSEAVVTFYPTATIANATNYYIVLRSATNNASNYVNWYRNTSGTVEKVDNTDNPGTGWVNLATTRQCKFITYGDS